MLVSMEPMQLILEYSRKGTHVAEKSPILRKNTCSDMNAIVRNDNEGVPVIGSKGAE